MYLSHSRWFLLMFWIYFGFFCGIFLSNNLHTDFKYSEKNNHFKIFCSETWAEMILIQCYCHCY
jgi:hypothetical protein